jgi:hypothetical protein
MSRWGRFWIIIELAHAQRDMANNAGIALGYDGKIKMVIDHGLVVMPFCTMLPKLPRISGSNLLAHGCKLQHVTVRTPSVLAPLSR